MLFKKRFLSRDSPSVGRWFKNPEIIASFLRKNRWSILLVCLTLILLFFLLSSRTVESSSRKKSERLTDYSVLLQEELESVLSKMSGVGRCSVFITFADGGETVYACDEDISSSEEKINTDRKYVLVSSRSEGLVLKVYSPMVLGVAVICQGGESARVKSDVTEVVSRTLGISADCISVKKMNS